jgi:hypothetical protein
MWNKGQELGDVEAMLSPSSYASWMFARMADGTLSSYPVSDAKRRRTSAPFILRSDAHVRIIAAPEALGQLATLDGTIWSRLPEDIVLKEILSRMPFEFLHVSKAHNKMAYQHIGNNIHIGFTGSTTSLFSRMLCAIEQNNLRALEIICNIPVHLLDRHYGALLRAAYRLHRYQFIPFLELALPEDAHRDKIRVIQTKECIREGIWRDEFDVLDHIKGADSDLFYEGMRYYGRHPFGSVARIRYIYNNTKDNDRLEFTKGLFSDVGNNCRAPGMLEFLEEVDEKYKIKAFLHKLSEYYDICEDSLATEFANRWSLAFGDYCDDLATIAAAHSAKSKLESTNWIHHAEAWYLIHKTILDNCGEAEAIKAMLEFKQFELLRAELQAVIDRMHFRIMKRYAMRGKVYIQEL